MAFFRSALLILVAALATSAADFIGTWKAVFTGPVAERPKMVTEMIFEVIATKDKLTGTAHMGGWPGDAPLSEGNVEGDRISFIAVGKSPWRAASSAGESSGLPKLIFSGTLQGGEIQLKVVWDNVMLYGDSPAPRELAMKAVKIR
jgi:hypothetical protein